jgi:RNA polymerase sigma factor (sigma-70 family)
VTSSDRDRGSSFQGNGIFNTTHWSVVLTARESEGAAAHAALEQLCQTYWYPLYAYVRRRGFNPQDAEDLTQGFLAHLLGQSFLATVTPAKGKFRSFLLAALQNYLADQRDRAMALKRGGGQTVISLDLEHASERYASEPLDQLSPDKVFDRNWAMALLERARAQLEEEYRRAGKDHFYRVLRQFNFDGPGAPTYSETAAQLDMSENTLKSLVHRFRQRYRQLLRDEIAQTVSSAAEVDDEIRYLLNAASA